MISSEYIFNLFHFSFSGLALSSLLTVQNDSIYQRFEQLLQSICEALNDIMKEDNEDPSLMVELVFVCI